MTGLPRGRLLLLAGVLLLVGSMVWVADAFGIINGTTFAAPSLSPATEQAIVAEPSELAGSWTLVPDDSFVGYRVFEPARDAEITGRTDTVTGSLEITGDPDSVTLNDLRIDADLRNLESDSAARDSAIRGRLLESDRYPDATFVVDDAVALTTPLDTGIVDLEVPGVLTVHETARPVTLTAQVQIGEARLRVVGDAPIVLSDFGIERPPGAVLSDSARVEFRAEFSPEADR